MYSALMLLERPFYGLSLTNSGQTYIIIAEPHEICSL